MLSTMSTSRAPSRNARRASIALISGVVAPNGNPITVQTGTDVPLRFSAARFTQVGLMHTEAKWYCSASRHS